MVPYITEASLILGPLLFLITPSFQVPKCCIASWLPACSPFVCFPEALRSLLLHSTPNNPVFTPPWLPSSHFPFTPTQDAAAIQDTDGFIPSPSFPSSWQMVWLLCPKLSRKFLLSDLQAFCANIVDIFLALFLPDLSAEFKTQDLEGPLGGSSNSTRWVTCA